MSPIRSALRRVLAALGLASRATVENLREAVTRAKAEGDKLKGQLAAARADLRTVKDEAKRAATAQAAALRETAEARARCEQLKTERDVGKRTANEWKDRAEEYRAKLREVRGKLESVEHSTRLAHEHLMSTEVKLDLVDAAIQALDVRTRAVTPDGPPGDPASPPRPAASRGDE